MSNMRPKTRASNATINEKIAVGNRRNPDIKLKHYYGFDKENLNHPIYSLSVDVPAPLRDIFMGFIHSLALRIKAKIYLNKRYNCTAYSDMFDSVTCGELENDYEDLGGIGVCPLCHKPVEGPYYYVEFELSKSVHAIISLKLVEHLFNEHNVNMPPQLASMVYGKYFGSLPIIKPIEEMDTEELIREVKAGRSRNEQLAGELMSIRSELLNIKAAMHMPTTEVSPPIELTIDTESGNVVNDEDVWDKAKEVLANSGQKSDDEDGDADDDEADDDEADGEVVEEDDAQTEEPGNNVEEESPADEDDDDI